jgi:uncharacterized protein YcfJ
MLNKNTIAALALGALGATFGAACAQDVQAREAQRIEDQYGIAGVRPDTIATADGTLKGTLVPITLANGQHGTLFVPDKRNNDPHAVYIRDEQGLHPVLLSDRATREEVTRSPRIVEKRAEVQHTNKRSWEKEALIIGGSAGAGTAIGALAGGKKGAGIGAAAGGVGGLIYDLLTREKK